jgi:sporulation protein YlmC with PRC-barrel domain
MRTYHRDEADQGPMILERLRDLDMARRLLGDFPNIQGSTVIGPKGKSVGRVTNLYVDPKQGRVVLASVMFGGLIGVGARHVLVPMDQLEKVGDGMVRVTTTPEIVKGNTAFEELADEDVFSPHEYWRRVLSRQRGRKHGSSEPRAEKGVRVEIED